MKVPPWTPPAAAGAEPGEDDGAARGALRPFLLDRLSDDWLTRHTVLPGDAVPPYNPVLNAEQYRRCVVRELRWLLNSTATPVEYGRRSSPLLAGSVVNYGLPDFSRLNLSDVRGFRLRASVQRAIERFEPRILPQSLHVRILHDGPAAAASLVIEGVLWALPVPETLRLRGDLHVSGTRRWELMEI